MIDICGLLLNILKSSTPGLLESGTTKMRQGGDGNGLAVLSRRCRFVNRPAGRFLRVLVVLAALVVWVGAQPASGQTDDDNVRMIPLAPQLEVPSEIGAVDVEVVALGSDATEVEAGGKSSVLIASDADGTLMLAAANEDGGYLGEGPGAVELGLESTAITLVAVASGRRFGEIDPELAQAIQSHEEFGRLTRLLKALMASDKNYLDRLYSYPQAVTLIKSVAAGVASAGVEPTAEADPGFKQLPERDVAQALAAGHAAAANSETGPIAPNYNENFYCVPGSGYSLGFIPCSPWDDREPWHWFGEAQGVKALFPENLAEWILFIATIEGDSGWSNIGSLANRYLGDHLPFELPENFGGKYSNLVFDATGTPPFLAVSEDSVSGCRSSDFTCRDDGLHATANPNFVNYAMELYDDGVYQDWFYTPGSSTVTDKLLNSGAAYREFRTGRRRNSSVLLTPDIDRVRFQRYRFSLAEGDEEGFDRGAVVSFMNTLHLVISVVNVITDVSEARAIAKSADVLNLAEPIAACSAEVFNAVKEANPDVIVDGQLVFDSDPGKAVQDLSLQVLVNVGPAYLAALQTPACQNFLEGAVKGGVSKKVLKEATSVIDDLVAAGVRQGAKTAADLLLIWVKLGYDAANDLLPVLGAYFRPAGDGVDYQLFWKDNPKEFPYIHMVSKRRPPTAHFTYTQKGGFRVELDASQTEPGDSDDLSFSWRVNDADVGRGERLVHDFRSEGRYRVEVVVTDGNGLTGTFSSAVDVVRGSPPEVTSLECTPTRYDTFRMVASFSDEDGDIETVEWRSNAGSVEPDRVTSAGTTQVELRASGGTTWASVIVEDRVGNRGSRVCNVNLEYVPTATLGIDSLSAACGREEPWRACYHRLGMNRGELFEFSVSMPREPTGTWHVAWCAKEEREDLCRGQHDWTTRIDKRFANEAPLTFPMTPPAGVETFWVVAEVRECNKSLCNWPDDFTEVEFHHIEVSVLPPAGGQFGETRVFDGIEFVQIPAGQFQMGSTSAEAESDEQPLTQVRISRGFWMGKYEVTQAQWEAVMGSNPSRFTNCGGDCPVERVSWNDVQDFIGRLNARSGGRPYRLPTEAEWEYAARAGTTGDRYGDLDEIAWYGSNSGGTPHRVGEKAANAWGLHDMLGNVWEWVQDWYGRYPGGSVTDPTGPESGSYRVERAGSWNNYAWICRSAHRYRASPGNRSHNLGFRLLREGGTGDGDGGDGDLADLSIADPDDWSDATGTTESRYEDGVLILGDRTRDYDELWSKETFGPGHRLEFDAKIPITREGYNRIGFRGPEEGRRSNFWFGTRWERQGQLELEVRNEFDSDSQFVSDPVRDGDYISGRFVMHWRSDGTVTATYNGSVFESSVNVGTSPMHVVFRTYELPMEISNFSLRVSSDDGGVEIPDVLFSEDYESYAVGSLPADYEIVFNGQGDAEQRVEEEGGNRHLRTAARYRWGLAMRQDLDFDLPPVVSVRWRMRLDNDVNTYDYTDPSGARYGHFGSFGIKNTDEVTASVGINKYESDKKIVAYCSDGDGSQPEVQLGVWTTFRMEVDFAAGRYSMYKDGVKYCERATGMADLSGRWNSWGESSGIHFSSGNSDNTVTRFDDIVIRSGSGSGSGGGNGGGGGGGGGTGQGVVFSDDFSSGTLDKWTTAGKESGGSPDPGSLSIVDGVLQMDATAGGNYTLHAVKEIRVAQPYGGYRLSFDWKAVERETPWGLDGVRLYFYDDQDRRIGMLVAVNSGQTRRGGDPLDHVRPTNLANDRFSGIGKLAETFDWEHVTLDTSMIPGMEPREVARLELRAWVYNDAGSGGEMHFDNFELRGTGSNAPAGHTERFDSVTYEGSGTLGNADRMRAGDLIIEVPDRTLVDDIRIAVRERNLPAALPIGAGQIADPVEISITDEDQDKLNAPLVMTMTYPVRNAGGVDEVTVMHFEADQRRWLPATVVSHDAQKRQVVFNSRSFSIFVAVDFTESEIPGSWPPPGTAGFDPAKHGFSISNRGYEYHTPGGNCYGMSAYAIYNFLHEKRDIYNLWDDTTQSTVATLAHLSQPIWSVNNLDRLGTGPGGEHPQASDRLSMLKREITQAPVILLLSRTLAPLVHAVVAYGFDGDELLIYDPNFPGASQRTTSRGRVYKACGNGNCTEYSVTGFDHYLSTGRRTDWESLTTYAVGGFERSNDLYVNVEDGQEVSVRDLDFSGALSGDLLDDAVKVSVKFDDVRPIETADDGTFSGSVEGLRLGENTLVFLAGIHHNLATVAGRTLQFWKKRYWDIGSAAVVRNVVGRFDAAAVQIRLQWSLPTDLDLYVQEPGGEVLFWGNRLADSGFELSRDNRRTGSDERRDSEIALLSNTDTVADGVYRLFVHQYDDYGYNEPVDFRVQVSLNEGTISEANRGWSHTMALGRHGLGSATTVRDLLGSGLHEAARVRVHLGRATVCWPYPEGTFDYCGDEFAATPVDAVNGDQTVVKPSANWVPDWLRETDVQISIDSSSVPSSCVTESPWRGCYHRGHRATDGDLVEVRVTMPREPSGSWHGAWCVKDTPEGLCRGRHDSTDNIEKRFAENASLSFDADVPQDVTSFWIVGEIRECRKSLCYWPTDYDEVEFHHIEVSVLPPGGGESEDTDINPDETRTFDGIEFVGIPAGEFQMGSTSSEADSDEQPVTQVRITRGFWMGKYEVTQAQWEAVMGSNPSHFTNCGGDCPVEGVSWEDVQEFIGKLNARSGGRPYRLPTEAEWEYAARAGTTEDRYGDLDEIAWCRSNSGRTTHPVGEKAANAWGLHDMLGNVWEWVQDWYGRYPGGSVTDPTGPASGSGRVFRGGSWADFAGRCRSAFRYGISPGDRDGSLGFRLLREE